jgi:GTPase Era involved in 16S rRNA processing
LSKDQLEKIKISFKKKNDQLKDSDIFAVSGVTGKNIDVLLKAMADKILKAKGLLHDDDFN